jgi:hypothetical protein
MRRNRHDGPVVRRRNLIAALYDARGGKRMNLRLRSLLAAARLYRFVTRKKSTRPTSAQLMSMPQAEFEAWVRSTGLKTVAASIAKTPDVVTDASATPRHA